MDIKNNYYSKYLKYKKKYVLLKGGELEESTESKELNVIIVSHNGRIRCLLKDIEIKIVETEYIIHKEVIPEIRFKNCSILKLVISPSDIIVELFYDGEVKNIKEGYYYYTKDDTNNNNHRKFIKRTFNKIDNLTEYNNILKKLHIKEEDLANFIWNFYLCRHGEGEHNKATKVGKFFNPNKYIDANLTTDGIAQAKEASSFLSEINFDLAFVSDLKRTRQTLSTIMQGDIKEEVKKTNFSNINQIYVLPCSHELDFDKSGSCDGKQKYTIFENENKMNSDYIKCITNSNLEYCKILDAELNWNIYKIFYNNKSRGISNYNDENKKHCRDTSMISMSLMIYNLKRGDTEINSEQINNWIIQRKELLKIEY